MQSVIQQCVSHAQKRNALRQDRSRHFGYVLQGRKVVEWAPNVRANPPTRFGYPSHAMIHAEFFAHKKARGILGNEDWWVLSLRFNKLGELRNAKPCPICEKYLRDCGCKYVVYSTDSGFSRMRLS